MGDLDGIASSGATSPGPPCTPRWLMHTWSGSVVALLSCISMGKHTQQLRSLIYLVCNQLLSYQLSCSREVATHEISFPLNEAQSLNVTMAQHGYIGIAPLHPSMAVSSSVLELLQVVTCRCPQLSLQAFTKTLCNLHCVSK